MNRAGVGAHTVGMSWDKGCVEWIGRQEFLGNGIEVMEVVHNGGCGEEVAVVDTGSDRWVWYNLQGDCGLHVPDLGVLRVGAGEWAIVSSSELRMGGQGNLRSLVFRIEEEAWRREFGGQKDTQLRCFACPMQSDPACIQGQGTEQLEYLANGLWEKSEEDMGSRMKRISGFYNWLGEFFAQPIMRTSGDCLTNCREEEVKSLKGVAQYLELNLGEEHSLQDLSRRFYINEFKLKRDFKALFGKTVFGYLRETRMKHASRLLLEGDRGVTEVCIEVGYSNPSHFARAFKEYSGLLPKAYQCIHRSR